MTKFLKLAFLFLFISNFAYTQNEKVNEKTLLWRISGNGLSQPSYLYGTIHIPNTKFMNFSDSLKRIVKTVNSVVVEMHEIDGSVALAGMKMEEGKSLKSLLGDKDYEMLEKRVKADKNMVVVSVLLDKMKPLLVSSQLSMQYAEKNTNFPMDFLFVSQAKERQQKVFGLETDKEQFNAFGNVNLEEQIAMLRHVLHNVQEDEKEMNEVIAAYLDQDIDKSASFITRYQAKYPNFVNEIMTQRNKRMIQRTDSLLQLESNRLIAVGAGHLGGNDGFIAVLRQKGYKVEAIMPTYTEESKIKMDYNPKWIPFKGKYFSCKFPNQKPTQTKPTLEHYQVDEIINGEKCTLVVYSQKAEIKDETRQQFYEISKQNVKENYPNLTTKDIKIDGLDAVELKYNTNKMGQTTRAIYIINKKMNVVTLIMIIGDEKVTKADFSEEFINSFKIK